MESAPRTDLGNAERLIEFAGGTIRYDTTAKKWRRWDGQRWMLDRDSTVIALAGRMLRQLRATAQSRGTETMVKFALSSEKEARIKSMVSLAQSQPGIPVHAEELDADPWLLNVANGTLDLRTGNLLPHDRANLITKLVPVDYSETADCPQYRAFLDRVMGGSKGLIGYLQKATGYTLTGQTSEQVTFVLYGTGRNGKTTYIEAVRGCLGDYAQTTDFTTFLQRKSDGIRNDIARLVGARFVAAVEADESRALSEALLKQLTGGDRITARFLFGEFFDYTPTYKIFLASNHKPQINGADLGIWRRLKLVPFTVTIPEPERDLKLGEKLRLEQAGILRWAVEGCLAWQREGLIPPPEIVAATDDYRSEMDSTGEFIEASCEVGEGQRVRAGDLHAAYADWAEETGNDTLTAKALAAKLAAKGFRNLKSNGQRFWLGLRVTAPVRSDAASPWRKEGSGGSDEGGSGIPF